MSTIIGSRLKAVLDQKLKEKRDRLGSQAYGMIETFRTSMNTAFAEYDSGCRTPEELLLIITTEAAAVYHDIPKAESYIDPEHLAWAKNIDAEFGLTEDCLTVRAEKLRLQERTIEVAIALVEGRVSYDFYGFGGVHCFGELMNTGDILTQDRAESAFREEFGNLQYYTIKFYWDTTVTNQN